MPDVPELTGEEIQQLRNILKTAAMATARHLHICDRRDDD